MKEDQSKDVETLVSMLLASERIAVADLRNAVGGYSDAVIGNLIWKAREIVRKQHGIDFGPLHKVPGYIVRRTPLQIGKYAGVQKRAGLRKQGRALERLVMAAETTSDKKERERLERAAEREKERQNFSRMRGEAKK